MNGRGFAERDTLHSVSVCLVNEAFVRRHFKDRNPIGARLLLKAPFDRTAGVAAAAPAWRASRIDPAIAFRHDG